MVKTLTPDEARERQMEMHRRCAVRFAEQFQDYNRTNSDWSYVPPKSDDPSDWEGITKWCALEQSYVFHCERESALARGLKPTYCPAHDEKPGEGFRPAPCFRCAWEADIYDQAISMARRLGKQWRENVAAGREKAYIAEGDRLLRELSQPLASADPRTKDRASTWRIGAAS